MSARLLPWNTVDIWFAWRPVRLSLRGNVHNEPEEDGAFFVDGGGWAWLRKVRRYRGLFLSGPVYMSIE